MYTDGTTIEEQLSGRRDEDPPSWRMVRFDLHDPAGLVADFPERTARQRERELMIALLEDAFNCYRKYAFSGTRRGRRLFEEAETWLMEPDTEAVVTFQYVCDVLGIDPDSIRSGLARWRGEAATGQTQDLELCHGNLEPFTGHGTMSSTTGTPQATEMAVTQTLHEEANR